MPNLPIRLTFRAEKDDETTRLKNNYNVFCFLKNQVDSNGIPLARGIYWPNIILDDKTVYEMGEINSNDTVIEVEIWIQKKKPIKYSSESKFVKTTKELYVGGGYGSISIIIKEETNAAGQLNRIVQPGWPRIG
jgi:hypothetical protein